MSLEEGLRVCLAVVARFNDDDFIVSLVVITVDASSAIESDKIIGGSSGLNLDNDGVILWIVSIISNTNNVFLPRARDQGIKQSLGIVVPPHVPVLVEGGSSV